MVSFSVISCAIASVFFTASAVAQNLINVDIPQPNANIVSKSTIDISYSVIGTQTVNPPYDISTTYPNSLSIDFVWTERANPNNVISFSVSTGLNTDPYPSGLQSTQHKESWKAPSCHFFARYPPTAYDFALEFTPVYPDNVPESPIVGTEQSKIVVPLAVTVDNSTFPKC